MRSPDDNPFRPGAGAVPEVWVGRAEILRAHAAQRRDRVRGRYATGAVIVGPSGIGKSVLVNRIAQEAQRDGDVAVAPVRIAKRSDPIAQLAAEVTASARQVVGTGLGAELERLLDRLRVVAVGGVELAVEDRAPSNPHLVVRDALVGLGTRLAHDNAGAQPGRERALHVRVDEVQNASNAQRSALIAALGDVLEHRTSVEVAVLGSIEMHLPVLLYLTGLPDLLNAASNVDTFRRRFTTTVLRPFSDAEVEDALLDTPLPGGVTVERAAARRLSHVVAGDPFLFQLVGKHAWDASTGPRIVPADVDKADRATYPERLRIVEAATADIPARERTVLEALYAVAGEDLTAATRDVAEHLDTSPTAIAPDGARLERRAAIERTRRGWTVSNRLLHRYLTTGDIQ